MLMLSILHSAIPQKIRHKSSNEIAESNDQLAISQRESFAIYEEQIRRFTCRNGTEELVNNELQTGHQCNT